ncbi:hypothetical protein CK203_028560 [Vitis vinifera]|uniref:Uncharacterized protein n=1 Tax=Vitis vinifera TaxID=29760 RepID=A0A438I282_VITVI|nr:hypothetical protein CK203_028560 [Vitis vinifera]
MGKKKEGGSPMRLGKAMGWGCGRKLERKAFCCLKNASFTVGDGRRVKFWKDIWCGNTPLCEAFPSLFAFAVSQDAWVEDCWDYMGDAGGWNPCFSRVVWNASKNGSFSVKSLYNTLDSGGAVPFPWRIIWSPCVPTKHPSDGPHAADMTGADVVSVHVPAVASEI